MKVKYLPLIFLLLCSFSVTDYFSKKTLIYIETKNNRENKIHWTIKTKDKNIIIEKTSYEGTSDFSYLPDYVLKDYTFKAAEENTHYTFTLENNTLNAQGIYRGKKMHRSFNLKNDRWIQDFNFGFHTFLDAKDREYNFIIINPSNFTINDMIAIKQNIETLKIGNTTYKTQKMIITLPGFKGHFWKAHAWFDLETKDLVKYKANEGPGTPTTVTTLASDNK